MALLAVGGRGEDHVGRNDAVLEDLLLVIDVVDERVEGVDALLQAALDVVPFGRRDDARHQVEGEDALGAGRVAVDVEGDAHLQQQALGGVLVAQQVALGERLDGIHQQPGVRPRAAVGVEQFVVKAFGLVGGELHFSAQGAQESSIIPPGGGIQAKRILCGGFAFWIRARVCALISASPGRSAGEAHRVGMPAPYAIMGEIPMILDEIHEGLTFDDVLLEPSRSEVLPAEVDTRTCMTRQIGLNVPIVSAAMDTVTESHLAIALAQQGGIGIVHRNMPIERQAEEVDRVKRSESGMIVDPITIRPERSIADAQQLMSHYRISGVPVTKDGKLVGILTNRDLRFETRLELPISEVMTKENLVTVPVGTTLEQAAAILHKHRVEKLLVVDEHFNLKGLITVKDIQKKLKYPNSAKDRQGRLRVGAAIGATGSRISC